MRSVFQTDAYKKLIDLSNGDSNLEASLQRWFKDHVKGLYCSYLIDRRLDLSHQEAVRKRNRENALKVITRMIEESPHYESVADDEHSNPLEERTDIRILILNPNGEA